MLKIDHVIVVVGDLEAAPSWRLAGLDVAIAEPPLPFFISWEVTDENHPGRVRADHPRRVSGMSKIELSGDEMRLAHWLGDRHLPAEIVSGRPGVRAVELAGEGPVQRSSNSKEIRTSRRITTTRAGDKAVTPPR